MKNLASLFLASMLAISPVVGQEKTEEVKTPKDYLLQLGVPEKFANYKEGNHGNKDPINLGGYMFNVLNYDIDGDGVAEVQEIYVVTSLEKVGEEYPDEGIPAIYGFDLNRNGIIGEVGEVLKDDAKDGINGNEFWFIPISSKDS